MEYLKEIFRELYEEDGLAVIAKGLGSIALIVKFLKLYCNIHGVQSAQSVFALNCSDEEHIIVESLLTEGVHPHNLPKIVNNEVSIQEREALYSRGGCFLITSRIMIVDLLTKKINPEHIAGFIVNNAHRVTETSVETFILRVYRQGNKTGFIKAVTDEPEPLLKGFSKVERILKHLFVQNLYLWPRFHASIADALAAFQPETIELVQPLSANMGAIQQAIVVAMDACMHELRKAIPHIDLSEMTLQNALLKQFDMHIRAQLDPEWHTISFRAKQLVNDLKTLRKLLEYLLRYDAVTFYSFISSLRVANLQQRNPSPWLSTEAADEIFRCSTNRVYTVRPCSAEEQEEETNENEEANFTNLRSVLGLRTALNLVIEEPPKWGLVVDTMKEIEAEIKANRDSHAEIQLFQSRVLIVTKDERTAQHIRDVLGKGGRALMEARFKHFLFSHNAKLRRQARVARRPLMHGKRPFSAASAKADEEEGQALITGLTVDEMKKLPIEQQLLLLEETKYRTPQSLVWDLSAPGERKSSAHKRRRNTTGRHIGTNIDSREETDVISNVEEAIESSGILDISKIEESCVAITSSIAEEAGTSRPIYVELLETRSDTAHVVVYSFGGGHHRLSILEELRPKFVILYDPDVEFVRRIEAFQATCTERVRVYFLVYESSVEEQKYLASLRREKEAFEMLIQEKANMVITPFDLDPHKDEREFALSLDSRLNPTKKANKTKRAVVDVREFRSTLPSLLHSTGIDVVPVTLQIGDYALAPEICVERKSISDLFQSFASGRLYNQVEAMSRHYKIPCLLIEFSPDQPFSLQPASDVTGDIQISNICSKLALLLLHFPNLRLFWSRSPHQTVEIFLSVKAHHPDVDVEKAISVGGGDIDGEAQVNLAAQELLMSLPGINSHNFRAVLSNVESIAELSKMNQEQLQPLIGPVNAKKLVEYFHATLEQPPNL